MARKKAPKAKAADHAHSAGRAIVGSIPLLGAAATELFNTIIQPPLERRRDEWLEEIAGGLDRLENEVEGFKIEFLVDNEQFLSATLHATQAALRAHQEEKREALRNAVMNSALDISIDDDLQMIFIHTIDAFTPWHLRILKFFRNPSEYFQTTTARKQILAASPAQLLEQAFPELKNRGDFYDQFVKDLSARGLLNIGSLQVLMTASGVYGARTTKMGNQFLDFVASPI